MNEPMEAMESVDLMEEPSVQVVQDFRPMTPVNGAKRKEEIRSNTDIYTRRGSVEREAFMRRRFEWPY